MEKPRDFRKTDKNRRVEKGNIATGQVRIRGRLAVFRLLDFSAHLVEPLEGGIHHCFTRTYFRSGDLRVRPVSTFCRPFNGRKILVVSITVAEEEQLVGARTFAQAVGVLAEKFS